jgi:essential nuclear protein 1
VANLGDNSYIDAPSSRKILTIAQDLENEDADERKVGENVDIGGHSSVFDPRTAVDALPTPDGLDAYPDDDQSDWIPDEDVVEEDVDPSDLAVYNQFLEHRDQEASLVPSLAVLSTKYGLDRAAEVPDTHLSHDDEGETTNLTDLILQRIAEKEANEQLQSHSKEGFDNLAPEAPYEIPPKIVEVFAKCGQLLSRYKSGPLPKPFKILPTLPSWPELLNLTRPDAWTPNAVLAATKIFISAPPAVSQEFVGTVLLDRVKEDIFETRKLNVHLYNAIKKALYKPAAFFKGFLFPLVIQGCTLREAAIISSVLVRVSIPALHSAAALLQLCEIAAEQSTTVNTESAGACNIFIRVLLEKKYALPYKAVDALVFHFLRFRNSKAAEDDITMSEVGSAKKKLVTEDKLPVLWHQSLLVFAQRYKNDITEDQREALLDLLLVRGHKDIGPEVRRELIVGRVRDQVPGSNGENNAAMAVDDGDDTMRDMDR